MTVAERHYPRRNPQHKYSYGNLLCLTNFCLLETRDGVMSLKSEWFRAAGMRRAGSRRRAIGDAEAST
jgi:hypothetical protein